MVVLSSISGLHSTTDIILHRGNIGPHDSETLIHKSMSIPPSATLTRSLISIFSDPGSFRLTKQHLFPDHPTKTPYDHPGTLPLHFLTKNPSKSSSRGPFEISQGKSIWWTEFTPIHVPQKIHQNTPATHIPQKPTHITPFHIPNLHPKFYPHQHSFHSPHPYSILYMVCTRPPLWPHRSHYASHQLCIPLLDPLPDAIMHPVVHRVYENIITLSTHRDSLFFSLYPEPSIG